jgi:two-component system sensor histidine kinase PilS (NtrC family)
VGRWIGNANDNATRGEGTPVDDRLATLSALVRWRAVVGAGALAFGLLLRPGMTMETRWLLLGAGCAVLAAVTGVYSILLASRRAGSAQAWFQALGDCALVTLFAGVTGGPNSQFVLLYVVVVLWAGVVLETTGGLVTAAVASTGYLLLGGIGQIATSFPAFAGFAHVQPPVPYSPALVLFLVALGAAAGSLGGRARRTRQTLALASREVERARLDTDRILESMSSGVLTLDNTGLVLHYNRSAEDLLGLKHAQVRGRWCQDVFGEGQRPLLERIQHTLDSGEPAHRQEVMLRRANGTECPVGLSTSFLIDEKGARRGVIAVFADLSDFRAAEERARRAETLAAIGQLSAGIAHEIRNCLNPISGSVELLQRELSLDGENAHLMALIGHECERLNRFVTELLDYAREPRFVVESVDVRALVEGALELVRRHPAYRPEIALELEPGEEAWARIDREQFKRVLVNLLQNAIEALEGPGRVAVRTRMERADRVVVEVSDTGPGIPQAVLARVTEPFFTTKRGGTGLGLAIAARIMERLNGSLKVTSAPGAGSTFTLELERTPALARAA